MDKQGKMETNGKSEENQIYSEDIFRRIDLKALAFKFKSEMDILEPAENLAVRPLELKDFDKGYLELLGQLTDVGSVSIDQFDDTFRLMKQRASHYITVVEDIQTGSVIASGTLFLEQKFIHNCGMRGRIEDVVVSESYRGMQLGKVIILLLTEMSKCLGCYKLSLECKDENRLFYEKLGFRREEGNSNFMQIRF